MKTLFKYLTKSYSKDKQEFWDKNSTSDKEDFFKEMPTPDIKRYNEIADIKVISNLIESDFKDWSKEGTRYCNTMFDR